MIFLWYFNAFSLLYFHWDSETSCLQAVALSIWICHMLRCALDSLAYCYSWGDIYNTVGFKAVTKKPGTIARKCVKNAHKCHSSHKFCSVEGNQRFREAARCTPSQHVETLLQVSLWCDKLQGQREELDLTPLYKRCPDAQETCRNIVLFSGLTSVIPFVLFLTFEYLLVASRNRRVLAHSQNAGYNPVM